MSYRYSLTRQVAPLTGEGTVAFVMLNPSTADAAQDAAQLRTPMVGITTGERDTPFYPSRHPGGGESPR